MSRNKTILGLSTLVLAVVGCLLFTNTKAQTDPVVYIEHASSTLPAALSGSTAPTASLSAAPRLTLHVDVPQKAKEGRLSDWLDALCEKESGCDPTIKHLDTNGKYSYGCFQFQMGTWLSYGKLLGFNTTPENIHDCALQRSLTTAMIQDNYRNWRHWSYTVKHKIGLPPIE